jgi:polysaccharide export outer membrane protein
MFRFSCKAAIISAFCLLLSLGGLSAVAQEQPATPAPQNPQNNPAPNNPAPQNPAPNNPAPANPKPINTAGPGGAGGAPVDSSKYKIGPADVLNIRVWNEPEFSGPVVVHEDGKFTLPLVGDLDAGGKTPIEVQELVAQALKKLVVKPLVTVIVQDVGSKRYYLDGQVNHPGEYALVIPTTVFEAISKAGGLGEFANQKKIYVLRGTERIPFNYKEVLKGKNMSQNILLKPGDHIVVP